MNFLLSLFASAQRLAITCKVGADSVQLRWAASNPEAWSLGNRYGFDVERITFNVAEAIGKGPDYFKAKFKGMSRVDFKKLHAIDGNGNPCVGYYAVNGKKYDFFLISQKADLPCLGISLVTGTISNDLRDSNFKQWMKETWNFNVID